MHCHLFLWFTVYIVFRRIVSALITSIRRTKHNQFPITAKIDLYEIIPVLQWGKILFPKISHIPQVHQILWEV